MQCSRSSRRHPRALALASLVIATGLTMTAAHAEPVTGDPNYRVELATLFGFSTRQVEAPGIDRTVANDAEWLLNVTALYKGWHGFSPGLLFNYDRTVGRSGPSASEVNLGVLVRYSFWDHFWLQGGYLFLMRRWDDARTEPELRNTGGSSSGTFQGGHSKAFLFGAGAQYPLRESLYLIGKVEGRIRYFDSRGGLPLINGAEHGGLSFSPYLGLAYVF